MWTGKPAISRARSARRLSISCSRIANFKSGSIPTRSVTRSPNRLQFRDAHDMRGNIEDDESRGQADGNVRNLPPARMRVRQESLKQPADQTHNCGGRDDPHRARSQTPAPEA